MRTHGARVSSMRRGKTSFPKSGWNWRGGQLSAGQEVSRRKSYWKWFLILLCIALPSVFVIKALAAQVTIDATVHTTPASHNGSSPTSVFISDSTGYAFYRDSTGGCAYKKTIDSGATWGATVAFDTINTGDCNKVAVWYDRWTPGDSTGTNIHILTMDSGDDDLFYTRLDTAASDAFTTVVNASANTTQGGTFGLEQMASITKGTDGKLYMGVIDSTDSYVIQCAGTCETATNWTEAGINPFDNVNEDWLILMPLSGGNIMAIRLDASADDVQSKVYNGTSWDGVWTNIDTNAPDNQVYAGHFGATINKLSGAIFLAYAADVDVLGTNDDVHTATYNGTSWASAIDVLTNDPRGITGVKIASRENSDTIYAIYSAQTTAGTASTGNVYYKISTDGMATWSSEQGPLNTASDDIYGARVNIVSNERIYATWYVESLDDLLGETVVDLAPTAVELSDFTATSTSKGVVLEWKTGFEVNNLGFKIYRQSKGNRVPINPSIIAGSALMAAQGTAMTAGNSYSWLDPAGTPDSEYYLEDIDIDGTRRMHGPVVPSAGAAASSVSTKQARAILLDDLNAGARENTAAQRSQRGYAFSAGSQSSAKPLGEAETSESATTIAASDRGTQLSANATTSSSQSQDKQKALASMSALKLSVREDGWYRATQAALVAAGLNANADMRYLQLYADGIEIPIVINSNKPTGALKAGDSIEFYGVALDTLTADSREYWLVSGTTLGKRIKAQTLKNVSSGGLLPSFEYTVERKERLLYFSGLLNGETENFFGQVINNAPVAQTLSVQHLNSAAAPRLEVALQGVTLQDHVVSVLVNGTGVGVLNFTGQQNKVAQLPIAAGVLREGENTVTLERTNGDMDISLVDYLRLNYAHTYQADNDHLQFTVSGRAQVKGFSVSNVVLLDITNPNSVSFYNPKTEKAADGYHFTLQTTENRTFLALTDQRVGQLAGLTRNQASNWSTNLQGADFVVITHRDFRNSVEPLAQLHRNEGMSVAVVDVEDVYDEFSFGTHNSRAIRDFLGWTQTYWTRVPRFVLLVGDGSFDPRNYLGNNGDTDLVPAHLIDTALLETVSDDWFVDFDNDGVGEIALGRLPVRTVIEADTMISKIVNYSPGNPIQTAVMVADRMDAKTNFNFEAASNDLGSLLPATIGIQKIYRGDNAASVVHDQIVEGINQGPLLVNFIGHGSVEVWTGDPILSTSDAAALNNGTRLPVFLMMTCLNGSYQNPARESLAESLVRSEAGGAVAVWASSGMTEPAPQFNMSAALYQQLFGSQPLTLGEAIRKAKTGNAGIDVRRTWILFGDPAMRLR
jgi:hypothetical protein